MTSFTSVPSGLIVKMFNLPPPWRLLPNEICVPFGDQNGSPFAPCRVIGRTSDPLAFMT